MTVYWIDAHPHDCMFIYERLNKQQYGFFYECNLKTTGAVADLHLWQVYEVVWVA